MIRYCFKNFSTRTKVITKLTLNLNSLKYFGMISYTYVLSEPKRRTVGLACPKKTQLSTYHPFSCFASPSAYLLQKIRKILVMINGTFRTSPNSMSSDRICKGMNFSI